MTQNRLRPLRLVQENRDLEGGDRGRGKAGIGVGAVEDEAAAKNKGNRASWMGWFQSGKVENG